MYNSRATTLQYTYICIYYIRNSCLYRLIDCHSKWVREIYVCDLGDVAGGGRRPRVRASANTNAAAVYYYYAHDLRSRPFALAQSRRRKVSAPRELCIYNNIIAMVYNNTKESACRTAAEFRFYFLRFCRLFERNILHIYIAEDRRSCRRISAIVVIGKYWCTYSRNTMCIRRHRRKRDPARLRSRNEFATALYIHATIFRIESLRPTISCAHRR